MAIFPNCAKIVHDVVAAACEAAIAGVKGRVIIINFEDIDRSKATITGNVISALALKSGAKAYLFTTFADASIGNVSLNVGTYFSNWQHDVNLRIFTKSEEAKEFMNNIAGAKVAIILENNDEGVDNKLKYEVYGFNAGLKATEAAGTTQMEENTVYSLTLGNGEAAKENSLPKSIYVDDAETTDALIKTLLTAAP